MFIYCGQEGEGIRVMAKKSKRKWVLLCCIAGIIALIYLVFFMPLPFVKTLWEDNILRHRMAWDINRRVVGLHEDEIIQMLGEPYQFNSMIYYRLRSPDHHWFWSSLVIRFDETRIAVDTINHVNPYHVSPFPLR